MVFLRQLFEAQDTLFQAHLKIHCNNILVINSVGLALETKADVDVFIQLCHELKVMKKFLTIQFVHVKEHQTLDYFSS